MATGTEPQDRPHRKAQANPGTVKTGTGPVQPQSEPDAKKRKRTGGGELLKTPAEMAQQVGFSKRTLSRLTKAKVLPVIRVGRLCFYDPARVMSALQRNCEQKEIQS